MSDFAPEPIGVQPDPAPEPDQWAGPSRDEWEAVSGALGWLNELREQIPDPAGGGYYDPQPQPQPSAGDIEWDPLADNALDQVRDLIRQEIAPIAETTQKWQQTEAQEQFKDVVADLQASKGEFLLPDSAEKTMPLARNFYAEMALDRRYGPGDRTAELAIERAYETLKAWEQQVGEAYYDRRMNELSTLGGARTAPPAPVAAGTQTHVTPAGDEAAVVRKYFGTP